MFTIDPKTLAIGGIGLPGMGVFVVCAIAFGLGARGWIDSLDVGESDDDFACIEDERGACSTWQGAIPVQLDPTRETSWDDQEANAPSDEDLMVEDEPSA